MRRNGGGDGGGDGDGDGGQGDCGGKLRARQGTLKVCLGSGCRSGGRIRGESEGGGGGGVGRGRIYGNDEGVTAEGGAVDVALKVRVRGEAAVVAAADKAAAEAGFSRSV